MKEITTPEEFRQWKYEAELVEELFAHVEQIERAILKEMGCPTDPVKMFDVVKGKVAWPKKISPSQKLTALHAMNTLVFLSQARGNLHLGHENPLEAARQALMAGLYAGHGALSAVKRKQAQLGGNARGDARAKRREETQKTEDEKVRRYSKKWHLSDDLQDKYRSEASYIMMETGLARHTVQRSLRRLKSRL